MLKLEGVVWKHFRACSRTQRLKQQKKRAACLAENDQKGYAEAMRESYISNLKLLSEVSQQVSTFFHVPMELYQRSQTYHKLNSNQAYWARIETASAASSIKDPHDRTAQQAQQLCGEWSKFFREAEGQNPIISVSDLPRELKDQQTSAELASFVNQTFAYDQLYNRQQLSEDELKEVFNHFNINIHSLEVSELV